LEQVNMSTYLGYSLS